MNTIKQELEAAGFTVRTNNGALIAILGKRPSRTDVDADLIGGKIILTIRRNGEETELAVADEAAAIAALQAAGIL